MHTHVNLTIGEWGGLILTFGIIPFWVTLYALARFHEWRWARHDKYHHDVDRLIIRQDARERGEGAMVRGQWTTGLRRR